MIAPKAPNRPHPIDWSTDGLDLRICFDGNDVPCLEYLQPKGQPAPASTATRRYPSGEIPLVSVRLAGGGSSTNKTAKSWIGGILPARLQYVSHIKRQTALARHLDIDLKDPGTGVEITQHFQCFSSIPVLRSWVTVTNRGSKAVTLCQVASFAFGGLATGTRDWWHHYTLSYATNTWFREAQWHDHTLPELGIDDIGVLDTDDPHRATMSNFALSNRGAFSTEGHLPMGALCHNNGKDTWLWQIEHNGSWRWEIGDWQDNLYVTAGGPSKYDHGWSMNLAPGDSFTGVPAALCHVNGGFDKAISAMNQYRRHLVRPHKDHDKMAIIFNDYMNCLMGDPDEEKILSLLDPVVYCGAEYFVIDAGWYADDSTWWDDVGLWEPSAKRFPSGFKLLLSKIRERGLIPGVWLEPEVIGVRSIVAKQLPEDAFFQECGVRKEERSRYQLDYTCQAVRDRMNSIIDRLVLHYGVGYFKFDYNIDVVDGSDATPGLSTGAAHLNHQRAYLDWVAEILDRHPDLIIENCSSGGQRMEYGSLSVHTIQSTSDQQDPYMYAAIAAACPTAVIPQQSATWIYPQPGWSDEKNAFSVVNALLGRIHLSGKLDSLSSAQLELIREGLQTYQSIKYDLADAQPFWPVGLPQWHDDWIVLGMQLSDGDALLSVWRRGGDTTMTLNLPSARADDQAHLLYPASFRADLVLTGDSLKIELPDVPCARLIRLSCNK